MYRLAPQNLGGVHQVRVDLLLGRRSRSFFGEQGGNLPLRDRPDGLPGGAKCRQKKRGDEPVQFQVISLPRFLL